MLDASGRETFESFFRGHYASVVRGLVLVAGSEGEAEDLAQEAFARALERWDRIRTMESPVGYVYRTAFNLNRNRLRHLARSLRRRPDSLPGTDPASEVEHDPRSAVSSRGFPRASARRSCSSSGSGSMPPRPAACSESTLRPSVVGNPSSETND